MGLWCEWSDDSQGCIWILQGEKHKTQLEEKTPEQFCATVNFMFCMEICSDRVPTADVLYARKIIPSTVCTGCSVGTEEIVSHILLHCDIACNIWDWLSYILTVNLRNFHGAAVVVKWAARQDCKNTMGQVKLSCVLRAIWIIWKCRNELIFQYRAMFREKSVARVRN